MIIGKHLIHGEWVGGKDSFQNEPVSGASEAFSNGTEAEVDLAAKAAEDAFASFSATSRAKRAEFLRRIAQEIEGRIEDIVAQGSRETGLPDARLRGECGRTTGQLRLFADHIDAGDYLDRRHDAPLPDRSPLPRPDLRLMQRPHWASGSVWRFQLPACLLDRGWRHGGSPVCRQSFSES